MPKTPAPIAGFPVVPCSVCGKPTDLVAQAKCAPCWELVQRLRHYVPTLQTPEARTNVRKLLQEAIDGLDAEGRVA